MNSIVQIIFFAILCFGAGLALGLAVALPRDEQSKETETSEPVSAPQNSLGTGEASIQQLDLLQKIEELEQSKEELEQAKSKLETDKQMLSNRNEVLQTRLSLLKSPSSLNEPKLLENVSLTIEQLVAIFNQAISKNQTPIDLEDELLRVSTDIRRISLSEPRDAIDKNVLVLENSQYGSFYCVKGGDNYNVFPVPSELDNIRRFPQIFNINGNGSKLIRLEKPALLSQSCLIIEKGVIIT